MSKRKTNKADCPGCGRTSESHTDIFYCVTCQCQYDASPEEGGDFSNDPTRRIIQQEEYAERRKTRRRGRTDWPVIFVTAIILLVGIAFQGCV